MYVIELLSLSQSKRKDDYTVYPLPRNLQKVKLANKFLQNIILVLFNICIYMFKKDGDAGLVIPRH